MRREVLNTLRSTAIEIPSTNGAVPPTQKITLTDRVWRFIHDVPDLTSAQVADELLKQFDDIGYVVGGADKRKTLLTTIGALVQRRRIHRDTESGALRAM